MAARATQNCGKLTNNCGICAVTNHNGLILLTPRHFYLPYGALAPYHFPKHHMLAIQMGCRSRSDEELGAVGVGASVCHRQEECFVVLDKRHDYRHVNLRKRVCGKARSTEEESRDYFITFFTFNSKFSSSKLGPYME